VRTLLMPEQVVWRVPEGWEPLAVEPVGALIAAWQQGRGFSVMVAAAAVRTSNDRVLATDFLVQKLRAHDSVKMAVNLLRLMNPPEKNLEERSLNAAAARARRLQPQDWIDWWEVERPAALPPWPWERPRVDGPNRFAETPEDPAALTGDPVAPAASLPPDADGS
jgi:hypothetical protein